MEIALATLVSFALCSISAESNSNYQLLPFTPTGLSLQADSDSNNSGSTAISLEYATISLEYATVPDRSDSYKISVHIPPTKDEMFGWYLGVGDQTTSSDLFSRISVHVGLEYTLFDSTADGEESRYLAFNPQYYWFGGLVLSEDWRANSTCTGFGCPPPTTPPLNDEIGIEIGIRANLYEGAGVIYSFDNINQIGFLGITFQF
jgi:hypothetical protein